MMMIHKMIKTMMTISMMTYLLFQDRCPL